MEGYRKADGVSDEVTEELGRTAGECAFHLHCILFLSHNSLN
jgi:hypothetical protein